MKITGAAAPLAVLRAILLQQAALRSGEKGRSHTRKGPGVMPHHKSQPGKVYIVKRVKVKMRKPRLMRAEGMFSLDYNTERRRQEWLAKHQLTG